MTVNKALLIGNLGADPEMRQTASGNAVCNLRIATSHRAKNQSGDYEDVTEWHSVVCFGKTAENVERFCRKGKQVWVEGRLQTRKWQDRDGNDKYSTEIVAHEIRFLGSKSDGDSPSRGNSGNSGGGRGGYGGGKPAQNGGDGFDDSSIPF